MSRKITRGDLVGNVEKDIAREREAQRTATVEGDHFTAEAHGRNVDDLLDERDQYSY